MDKPTHILTENFLALSEEYFTRVVAPSLDEVKSICEPTVVRYVIAGKHIEINFYGEHMVPILGRALAHNKKDVEGEPDLKIHAWDSKFSRTPLMPPWDHSSFQRDVARSTRSFCGVYVGGEESLNFYDPQTRTGYFWTQSVAAVPDWVLGAPFRTIFHWFFGESDIHFIHGAVIGDGERAVLITAKSGSGKSTTALSAILRGMTYVGDDYVAVELTKGPVAHSVYHSAKITKKGLDFFPEFASQVVNKNFGAKEKAVIFLSEIFPESVRGSVPMHSVLIPRISKGETRITPASKIEAMLAIAPTTLLQLPLAETNKITMFKKLLENVPCYYLDLGSDVRGVPEVIRSFLSEDTVQ